MHVINVENTVSLISSDGMLEQLDQHGFEVEMAACDDILQFSVLNRSGRDIHLNEVHLDLPASMFGKLGNMESCRQYIHWIDFTPKDGVKPMSKPAEWAQVSQPSNMFTVISDDSIGYAVLLGALPPYSDGFTWFDAIDDGKSGTGPFGLRMRVDFNCKLAAGDKLIMPPLIWIEGHGGEALLEQYACITAARILQDNRKAPVTGWSSWDYYGGAVTRKGMDENRAKCAEIFGDDVEYMVIDDGYQNVWGDWGANWKFSGGLMDYCNACLDDGRKPGIWIAPLMVSVNSPLFRSKPEWFLAGFDGNVYEFQSGSWGVMAQLDPTMPEVQQHLREIFRALRNNGFAYYKIDFTQLLLEAGGYADASVGRAGAYHILFDLIRDEIGPDAYLLSCGAPYEAVLGRVDSVRTGGDIHNYKAMAAQCARSLFGRVWLQKSVCNIDPDFLIVRCSQTSDEKYLNRRRAVKPLGDAPHWCDGPLFDMDNAKFWALANYFAGGDMVLGDRIAGLNDKGIEILKRVLKKGRQPARWINQFDQRGQNVPVLLTEYPDRYELGVFNISKSVYVGEIPAELPCAEEAVDFWTGEKCEFGVITLKPCESLGVIIIK